MEESITFFEGPDSLHNLTNTKDEIAQQCFLLIATRTIRHRVTPKRQSNKAKNIQVQNWQSNHLCRMFSKTNMNFSAILFLDPFLEFSKSCLYTPPRSTALSSIFSDLPLFVEISFENFHILKLSYFTCSNHFTSYAFL